MIFGIFVYLCPNILKQYMTMTKIDLENLFNQKFTDLDSIEINKNKMYQTLAKFCASRSSQTDNQEEIDFWNGKETYCMGNARLLSSSAPRSQTVQDGFEFKTDYKFSSNEERTLYQRFVDVKENTTNKLMYYSVTDRNYNYKTKSGEYFHNHIKAVSDRFKDLTNYEYVIVDKHFLENNEFEIKTEIGKQYALYVDVDDFNESTKENVPSTYSTVHKGCIVFKTYETMIEFIMTYVKHKAIYIISDQAFNALRYLVSTIELVVCDNLDLSSYGNELVKHDLKKYADFLSFRKFNNQHYINRETVEIKVEPKTEHFSNFIRFKQPAKQETKSVTKDVIYDLITISKPAAKLKIFRHAKRSGKDQTIRLIQVRNILITLSEKLQIEQIDIVDEDFKLMDSKDYILHGTLTTMVSLPNNHNFNEDTIDALVKVIQIQIK